MMMKVSPMRLSSSPSSVRMSGALVYMLVTCREQGMHNSASSAPWACVRCALLCHAVLSRSHKRAATSCAGAVLMYHLLHPSGRRDRVSRLPACVLSGSSWVRALSM